MPKDSKNNEVKFTEEELESIKGFQQRYLDIQMGFGQVEINRNRLDEQYNSLEEGLEKLRENLTETQTEEREFIQNINKKYGDGVLDPTTGVFTPNPVATTTT
tara:strand:+ start:456 stop:764 length:309 start_codon:yes stop_codon:yes gene_type:complete